MHLVDEIDDKNAQSANTDSRQTATAPPPSYSDPAGAVKDDGLEKLCSRRHEKIVGLQNMPQRRQYASNYLL
ncbi:hypothetical protein ON010_g11396 [Phytophthora cinnamomi]|nr:hypothetical protein ON010_g11396 [Phytophthora cinnamomi]